jgi:predicted DCC family thiol-disulfide oxidoreductase YuxK
MEETSNSEKKRIIFYDGDCGFCNSSVQFILDHRKKTFYFAPLQSDFAKKRIEDEAGKKIEMNTLYFLDHGKLYEKSTAVLRISRGLKGVYPVLFYVGIIFPKFIRDGIYDFVAKRRHKINPNLCAMPSEEERTFFLG